jgi:type I restriction enzyme M protein
MPTIKPNKIKKVIAALFQNREAVYGLKEFESIDLENILYAAEKEKGVYYLKDIKSGAMKFVYNKEKQTGKPEEIIRQLWLYKLNKIYRYPLERIETEKSVHFGTKEYARADIVVYLRDKFTPYIIVEVKKPKRKDGVEQLKSYLAAEGAELGVWSNGKEKVVLHRKYPKEQETYLSDIPAADQTIDDLFEIKKSWSELKPEFDFVEIIKKTEELALAGSGANVFEEIFKLIYAKLYDEKQAREYRPDNEITFKQYQDPQKTYDVINELFKKAISEWPDIFELSEKIKLPAGRLHHCVPFFQDIRLFELDQGELEIIDSAFEYLITEVAKGTKGQYFTPRHVIKMCVKMLDPKENESVVDPACGSGGFLLHTMYYIWEKYLKTSAAQKDYAVKRLYGIDFDDNMRRISQALMLIAGDGKHHIFKRNSLDAIDWQGREAEEARVELKKFLTHFENLADEKENLQTYRKFDFDILLTNPPFAGENPEKSLLRQYELAKNDGKLRNNVERHILFIERSLDMIRSGGRMAIVLPQGVLNNTNMRYIREFLFAKARILAVVGLHGNTFKPHTGTKTSVLFLQKWIGEPLNDYPIFMAVSKKSGKDNSGDYVYKKDKDGNFVHDNRGRKVLDHDLDAIAEAFIKFAKEQKFDFWR